MCNTWPQSNFGTAVCFCSGSLDLFALKRNRAAFTAFQESNAAKNTYAISPKKDFVQLVAF